MPSSQWRFAIRPSQAAQASSVEGSGLAARKARRWRPILTPRSSRICQCGRPPPCSWSATTSSLQARMMRMRVSQSLQLAATLSLSTELRWRVFSRCCRANMRARPRLIGSWNQRQRATNASTTLSILETTLMRVKSAEESEQRDEEHHQRPGGEKQQRRARDIRQVGIARHRAGLVVVFLLLLLHDLVMPDDRGVRVGLQGGDFLVEVAEEI